MNKKWYLLLGLALLVVLVFVFWPLGRKNLAVKGDGNVTITVWDKLPPYEKQTPEERLQWELQKQFARENPQIKVKHTTEPPMGNASNWTQVITTVLAGSADQTIVNKGLNPAIYRSLAQKGYFVDLTKEIEGWDEFDKINPNIVDAIRSNGKIYGMPAFYDVLTLAYQNSLFREAGLDPNTPPEDWNDLVTYAQKLTKPEKHQYGFTILGTDFADWWLEMFVWQAGGDLTTVQNDGTVKLRYTEQPVVRALKFWHDLVYKYKVVQKNPLMDLQQIFQDWTQGRVAMTIFSPNWVSWQVEQGLKPEDISLAPLPRDREAATAMAFQVWAINAKASPEQVKAACKYIKFMLGHQSAMHKMQWRKDNGVQEIDLPIYQDIDVSSYYTNLPKDWLPAIKESNKIARMEYFGKEMFCGPLVKVIQTVLMKPQVNIPKLLAQAEKETYETYINKYNRRVTRR